MLTDYTSARLHRSRSEQLKMIARARGVGFQSLLGRFIRSEIEAGTIPDVTPGLRWRCIPGGDPQLLIGDVALVTRDPGFLAAFASLVADAAAGRMSGGVMIEMEGHKIGVARSKRGVSITATLATGEEGFISFPRDLAAEAARQLKQAAEAITRTARAIV